MSKFWEIIQSWDDGLGQAVFFLIAGAGILGVIERSIYYITVLFRGWPSS